MSTNSKPRLAAIASKLGPKDAEQAGRTLWRARLRVPPAGKDEFLFRSSDEFSEAAFCAQTLLEGSPSCKMVGAEIISLERVARLWN